MANTAQRFINNDITRQIRVWKTQLSIVIHDEDMPQKDRFLGTYMLDKNITDTLREEAERKKTLSETHYDVECETLRTTSWTHSAKGYHPRESIRELKIRDHIDSNIPRTLI